MPALNEELLIEGVIREIPKEIDGIDSIEVLVIDDGSTDASTDDIRLRNLVKKKRTLKKR